MPEMEDETIHDLRREFPKRRSCMSGRDPLMNFEVFDVGARSRGEEFNNRSSSKNLIAPCAS